MKNRAVAIVISMFASSLAGAQSSDSAQEIAEMPLMKYGTFTEPEKSRVLPDSASEVLSTSAEYSLGYFHSTGGVDWSMYNGSAQSGKPTSRLDWRDIPMNQMTLDAKWISNDKQGRTSFVYARAEFGTGDGGEIQDDDWYSDSHAAQLGGPTRWSSMLMNVSDGKAFGAAVGGGRRINPNRFGIDQMDMYTGISFHYESYEAYGIKVLSDPYGYYPHIPNSPLYLSAHVLSMDNYKLGWEIGSTSRFPIAGGLYALVDLKAEPLSVMYSRDKHLLRDDINGPIRLVTAGIGYSAQVALGYKIREKFDLTAGYRLNGYRMYTGKMLIQSKVHNYEDRQYDMVDYEFERGGLFASLSAKF